MSAALADAPERGDCGKLLLHASRGYTLEAVDQLGQADLGGIVDQQMNVILLAVEFLQFGLEVGADRPEDFLRAL
jgi:hypothetical protein